MKKTPQLVTPVLTPFVDGKLDAEALNDIIFGVSGQVDEIVILETTGGGHEHSLEICQEVLEHCAGYQEEINIRVGIIRDDSAESIHLIQHALELGYEHFMVGAPEGEEEDPKFWEDISDIAADATSVLLYNRPGLPSIPHGTIDEIGDLFDGIKDSSGDAEDFLRLLDYRTTDFRVFLGDEAVAEADPEILRHKKLDGIISGSSNIPKLAELFNRWLCKPDDAKVLAEIQTLKAEIATLNEDYRAALRMKLQDEEN